jgi:hypothetical protein
VSGAAAALLLLSACAESTDAEPPAQNPPAQQLMTPGPVDPTAAAVEPVPPPTPEPSAAGLPDGRHPALIKGIDVGARQVTIDVVQFFTGTAAATAAQEDGAAEIPPPNDYWVRNKNTLLRTLSLAPDARITVNTLAAEETGNSRKDVVISLETLASYGDLTGRLFWVTVAGNVLTVVAEQYLP